jgi:cobalt-precorrin 5A hydrolase/precorrin-3B C17-methyltransferase
VLAVAEDGSAVVPLLGGLGGVNRMAREIAAALQVSPAITTSGELRFGTCLLEPPPGYVLADIEQGKGFVSDLLGGQPVRIEGAAPWLDQARLPLDQQAARVIHIGPHCRPASADELLIYPQQVAALIERPGPELLSELLQAMQGAGLAPQSLACLLASPVLWPTPSCTPPPHSCNCRCALSTTNNSCRRCTASTPTCACCWPLHRSTPANSAAPVAA